MVVKTVFYRVKKVKGRYYLVKEWWDSGLKRKITKSLGPCDKIETLIEELKAREEWRRGRDSNPRAPVGHWLSRPKTRLRSKRKVSPVAGSQVDPYYVELWETWCLERGTSPETCRSYASYLRRPLDPSNRWSAKAWKLYYKWRCGLGDRAACEEYERVRVPQARPDLKVPSLASILETLGRAGPYRQVYTVMLESGLRLVEAARLVREYGKLECVKLGGFRRCLLGRQRGKKRSLWAYHVTPVEPDPALTARRVSKYAERHGLIQPKYLRKFVATKMAELDIPPHIIDFIQGRAPRTTLTESYAQLLGAADKHYPKYAQWLRQALGGASDG